LTAKKNFGCERRDKMGKWKAVFPIALALVIAFSGSVFLYKWLQAQTKPKEVVKVESEAVPIAVTAVDLAWGTKLKKEMVRTTPFLKESLPPGYFSDPSTLEGRVLITALKQNEPITESKLAPEDVSTGGVSAILKPGKRAIAVKGDKVIGISGFIQPGNLVDVLVTLTDPRSKKEVTKLVLRFRKTARVILRRWMCTRWKSPRRKGKNWPLPLPGEGCSLH
jgi:pilus assembly protein CpaB